MTPEKLFQQIKTKKSLLCVGLDTDPRRLPEHLKKESDPVFAFNRAIIEATADYAVAYKPNLAFYESMGPAGWESLAKTLEIIPKEIFTIADAKRGDIGNTSHLYARTFFETYDFDSVTIAPYMGRDSVEPFLQYEGKWVFLLGLTSNAGSRDFQWFENGEEKLFERVIRLSKEWAATQPGQLGFVVGATQAEQIGHIRGMAKENFFLVPGVGAQGGDLQSVLQEGLNDFGGLLINSSRGIIYADSGVDFAKAAGEKARGLQEQMATFL